MAQRNGRLEYVKVGKKLPPNRTAWQTTVLGRQTRCTDDLQFPRPQPSKVTAWGQVNVAGNVPLTCLNPLPRMRGVEGMILHQLIWLHRNYEKNAHAFFELQARDAIQWLERGAVHVGPNTRMLDLGCGHGYPGKICAAAGAEVTYADYEDLRLEELKHTAFHQIDLNESELSECGQFDLVMCSNVLEHLSKPNHVIQNLSKLLKPNGVFYLSWTNWLSPWGGHEFSPLHYLGKTSGSIHTVGQNLFKTYIGNVLKTVNAQEGLSVQRMAPRYYNEFSFLMQLPGLREFLTWNCALQIQRSEEAHSSS